MNINYIIFAHKNPVHLKRLVEKLNTAKNFFYIHVDKKTEIKPFKKELEGLENIYFFDNNRINIIWGHISGVYGPLLAIKKIIQDNRKGYCVFLSGQDYPLKSNEVISKFFIKNYGINFITTYPIEQVWKTYKRRINNYNFHLNDKGRMVSSVHYIFDNRFFSIINFKALIKVIFSKKIIHLWRIFYKREYPENLKPYGGSAWWAFPIETIHFINDFIKKNKSYLDYHEFTHIPDEIFFQGIISNNFPENVIRESLTYVNWSAKNRPLPLTFEVPEFDELSDQSYHLYARKFNENSEILDKIDNELLA